ncbi:MAG TPA: TcpQ domain-containing protein [Rhodanobacteraceae bacterium]|nr:TcpQ domain-containing protein [Rhodanobacteraceae bacterium]
MFYPSRIASALLLLALSPLAAAGCGRGQVTRTGDPMPATTVSAAAAGKDIEAAVKSLAPAGWTVANPDHATASVSWSAGQPADRVLQDLARQADVCVTIDGAAKSITLHKAAAANDGEAPIAAMPAMDDSLLLAKEDTPNKPAAAPAPAAPAKHPQSEATPASPKPAAATTPARAPAPTPTTTVVAARPAPAAPAKPAPAARSEKPAPTSTTASAEKAPSVGAPRPIRVQPEDAPIAPLPNDLLAAVNTAEGVYDLRAGETLRQALARWTKDASWVLVWRAEVDFEIDAPVSFPRGTSLQEAVRLTMKAFWARQQALTATVYKNQVLLISGRNAP